MPVYAPEKRLRRAALYVRVSATGDRDRRLQLDELRTAARQRDWQVVGELTDVKIQGGKDRRPELHRLMQLVRRGMVDVVAVWRLGDFARSKRHLAALDELRAHGVDFFAARDAIDSTCSVSSSGAIVGREPDAGLQRTLAGSRRVGDCGGIQHWQRAVRDPARARRRQIRLANKAAPLVEPRSAELSEADIRRALSRYLSMRFQDGSLLFPGMVFGPIVRAANPAEHVRETTNAIIAATLEQEPS